MNLCTLLVACCVFMSALQYATVTFAPTRLTVRIYHRDSQSYIRGTVIPEILTANGGNLVSYHTISYIAAMDNASFYGLLMQA